jgi:hypothetical protein
MKSFESNKVSDNSNVKIKENLYSVYSKNIHGYLISDYPEDSLLINAFVDEFDELTTNL